MDKPFDQFDPNPSFPTLERPMRVHQKGFTMIELIVVIVILGVLAATALPKFIDMRGDAEQAAVDSVAGAAGAAMNLNYSGCALTGNVATTGKCVVVDACADVGTLMQGGLPSAYAASAVAADIGTTNGNTASCSVSKTVGTTTYSQTFIGVAAGN
jgi:MSHA pilin protein MshA